MKEFIENLLLALVGGALYCLIEVLFRWHTYPSMFVVGGVCFLLCGLLNEFIPWEMPLQLQMLTCAVMITAVEFLAGLILNVRFGLGIWDYSNMPLNFMGQICLPFSVAWFFISGVAIILDDYLRYWFFKGEKPHYVFRRRKC